MSNPRRPPSIGLAVAAVLFGGLVGSFFPAILEAALSVAVVSTGEGKRVTIGLLLAAGAAAVLVRAIIATVIVTQIVAYAGAYVSYGRAFLATIAGGVFGQGITIAIAVLVARHGSGSGLASNLWLLYLMPLIGLVLSVAILVSPGESGGPPVSAIDAYHVPPGAPDDWFGR